MILKTVTIEGILRFTHQRYIAYNPALTKLTGSLESGVLLASLLNCYALHGQGFYRTMTQCMDDTGMSEREYRRAFAKLKEKQFVMVERRGLPARNNWFINESELASRFCEIVQSSSDYGVQTGMDYGVQTGLDYGVQTKKKEEKKEEKKITRARSTRFTPPTETEVDAYAREKNLRIDAGRFCDFYASKGWRVGNASMKDWKAAVRNWCRNDKPKRQEAVL